MAHDAKQRQKKLERKKAKKKRNRRIVTRWQDNDFTLRAAENGPILHCMTTDDLFESGIGNILISRSLPNRQVIYVVYLVDMYCLGIKDVTLGVLSRRDYDHKIYQRVFQDHDKLGLEPETARKLIEGAVEYAHNLGLSPHSDYNTAKIIYDDVDPTLCKEEFEYGLDDQPYFVAGPYDTRERCKTIIGILNNSVGHDGFVYILPVSRQKFDELIE